MKKMLIMSLVLMFSAMLTHACTDHSLLKHDNSDIVAISLQDQTDVMCYEYNYVPVTYCVEIHTTKMTAGNVEEKVVLLPVVILLSDQILDVRLCDIGSMNKFSLLNYDRQKNTKHLFGYSMSN